MNIRARPPADCSSVKVKVMAAAPGTQSWNQQCQASGHYPSVGTTNSRTVVNVGSSSNNVKHPVLYRVHTSIERKYRT